MCALETGDVVVVTADHVRRPRKQLEIVSRKRSRLIGARQRLERIYPRRHFIRSTSTLELIDRAHHRRR
jgi:hypothetical protein